MITKVLHTGYRVQDLEKSIKFYISMGFKVTNRFEKPDPKAHVATVQKDETIFELWRFEETAHPQVKFIQNHIAVFGMSK